MNPRTTPIPPQPAAATSPRSRPPLERMLRIHQAVQAGKYPNASTLALDLEVSTKSIQRDIEFMRDRFGLPLEYDGRRFGYHYTEPVSSFPTLQITEGELFALLVAEKALEQYRGTRFYQPLVTAFQKLSASLPGTISFNIAEWEQTISFRISAAPILNLEILDVLARAAAHHQQLEILYRKPGGPRAEPRVIDPYHLANINGEWFLFAYDHLRKDIRTFAPGRVQSARPTGSTFTRPQKFSLEDRLRDSFSVHTGKGEHDVVLRFNARAADYIREKRWHPSQALRDLKGGGVELHLKLSSLVEVERWILSWGGNARVIRPAALKESVRRAAQEVLAQPA